MTGYIVMGVGIVLVAAGLIIGAITAVTAPSAKRKIEKRMKEKY